MSASAHEWLAEWAGAVGQEAAADLDLPALAATLADLAEDEGEPDPDDLELLGDVLLDLERTRAAWIEQASRDEQLRETAGRLRALFLRAVTPAPDLTAVRREAVRELLRLASGMAEHRLRQAAWARDRREKRARAKHLQLPAQLDGRERAVDARANLEAEEAAETVAEQLRGALGAPAIAALRELMADGGSGTASAVAERHGLSAPTLSRAKARLGNLAAEALRDVPDDARRPFWDALERALARAG